jgi:hypothetical protein
VKLLKLEGELDCLHRTKGNSMMYCKYVYFSTSFCEAAVLRTRTPPISCHGSTVHSRSPTCINALWLEASHHTVARLLVSTLLIRRKDECLIRKPRDCTSIIDVIKLVLSIMGLLLGPRVYISGLSVAFRRVD